MLFQEFYFEQKWHFHSQHLHNLMFMPKVTPLPPANIGWSMNDGGVSAVGRRRLEYQS